MMISSLLSPSIRPLVRTGLLLGALALLVPQWAAAQVPQQFVNAPVSKVQDVHPTDVDGDGNVDLVAASKRDVNLGLFQGNGDGTFSYRAIPLDRNARSVHAADLDGDSVEEVLAGRAQTTGNLTSTITWHDPDGGGSFTADTIAKNIDSPEDLDAADLDGNGTPNVIAATVVLDSKITWYKKDGSGSFSANTIATGLGSKPAVEAADLDGDKDIDVIAGNSDGVFWYENDGNGSFIVGDTISTEGAFDIYATDQNGDGDVDVFATDPGSGAIWYENDGSASFTSHPLGDGGENIYGSDVDGDGDTDLVTNASSFSGDIAVFFNLGDGSFGDGTTIEVESVENVSAANLDGDNSAEIVFAGQERLGWHDRPDDQTTVVSSSAGLPYAADVDGDEDTDVLSVSNLPSPKETSRITWHENDGSENFTPRTISTSVTNVQSIAATDLNADDETDILIGSTGSDGTVLWFENDGEENFTMNTIEEETNLGIITPTNLDGENGTDVLAGGDGIYWYENDGSTSFTKHKIASETPGSLYATDLDGDGDTDVLVSTDPFSSSTKLSWYENDGSATPSFTEHIITSEPESPTSVSAANLDGDGDTDVLLSTGDTGAPTLLWFENDGSESFTSHTIAQSSSLGDAFDVHASDVNGDGKTDVIVPSQVPSEIRWYENDGSGSFTGHTVTTRVTDPTVAIGTDLNGDGMTDILSSSPVDNKIAWYENTEGALPVDLAGLSAQTDGSSAVLTWTTVSETNNAGFVVQHKAPTVKAWTKRGFVESTAAGGTTTEAHSYQFAAKNLSVGTHEFRLKQVDLDGTAHFSRTVTVELGLDQPVRLGAPAPNPVRQRATLSFAVKEAQTTTIRLYNVLGQQVATLYQGTPPAGEAQTVDLSATGLSSGVYFLRLQAGERIRTQRLTVIR